jgi:hypothetical protein
MYLPFVKVYAVRAASLKSRKGGKGTRVGKEKYTSKRKEGTSSHI